MRYYIDVGTNYGTAIDKFRREVSNSSEYSVICFEPNPELAPSLMNKNVVLWQCAASTNDALLKFYVDSQGNHCGSTLEASKKTRIDVRNYIEVKGINFSKWVQDSFSKDDFIILKMDIEGSEFDVVPAMIESKAIEKIGVFILDTHEHKLGRNVEVELKQITDYFDSHPSFVYGHAKLLDSIHFNKLIRQCPK